MSCEYCLQISGKHDCRCPNYISPKTSHYCSICGEGIYDGEEYIENDDGEYAHTDCFSGISDVIEWLGYDVRIMSE